MAGTPQTLSPAFVRYIADAGSDAETARLKARALGIDQVYWLSQRNSRLGWIGQQQRPSLPTMEDAHAAWKSAHAILLSGFLADDIPPHSQSIAESCALMEAVLQGAECENLLSQEPYTSRIAPGFEILASTYDEGDLQGIVKIEFDAVREGEIVADNIWLKIAWLSYAEQDASLRFRFSFGMENYEDVAADPVRQRLATQLCEAIFPESAIISHQPRLAAYLRALLQISAIEYVERIVYFNAPEGGAQFHHDIERGHLGVVFAQITGRTAWFALSTDQLLDELLLFLNSSSTETQLRSNIRNAKTLTKLRALTHDRTLLATALDDKNHDALELILNRTPAFSRQLIEHGHCYILHPGDIMLLPQHDVSHCCRHAVYCLDEQPGQALSFAIRHTA